MEQESRNSMGLIVIIAALIISLAVGGLAYMINENSRSQKNNELTMRNELQELKKDISDLKTEMDKKSEIAISTLPTQIEQMKEETPPMVSENTVTPVVTPTSIPTTMASTLVDCKTSYECFAARAKTCEKTKLVYVYTTEPKETPGVVTSFSIPYEITGLSNGKCEFFHGALLMKVSATEAGKQLIMKSEGITKEAVENEIAQTNKGLADAAKTTKNLYCTANTGLDISTHIQKWSTGQQTISSINGKTTYGPNITCIER